MKTIYNRRQEPDMTRTLRREDTSYFSLYIKMAQPSIAMGEDLLCDPDPCLTDTFFQVPTLDRVQGRDLVIAGTKVDTCHRVLAGTPFLVSSGQPTALYSLQSSCFKMASDRAKWSDYVPPGGGGVLGISRGGDDRIEQKVKTQENPSGFQQNPKKPWTKN